MKKLWMEYGVVWVVALVLYVLLPQQAWSGDEVVAYVMEYACIIITLLSIYVSLRLFSMSWVKRRISQGGEVAFERFWRLRLRMLELTVYMSIVVYSMTLESSYLFCLLIALLAILFVTPSEREKDMMLKE